jgi:hypothetical protein
LPPKKTSSANKRTLAGQLARAGYTFPFSIEPFITRALTAGVADTFSYAYALIINSKVFRNHYQGIFRPDGTLKMKPAQYDAYVYSAQTAAQGAGLNLTRKKASRLIANDVSADEFSFRIQAAQQISKNTDVLNAFNAQLKASGQRPMKDAQQIFGFLTGRGTKRTYDLYERAVIRGGGAAAGQDISAAEARRLGEMTTGVTNLESVVERFTRIQQDLLLAEDELRAFGVSERDLRTGEFSDTGVLSEDQRRRLQAIAQRKTELETRLVRRQAGLDRRGRLVTAQPPEEASF